jgi:hypothetical protein
MCSGEPLSDTVSCFVINMFSCQISCLLQFAHKSLTPGATHCCEGDLPVRWIDPEKARGNLELGRTLFGEPIIEVVEGRSYSWEAELERHRVGNFYPRSEPPCRRAPSFTTRSLRRV